METQFVHFGEVRPFQLAEGATGRPLFGEGAMINLVDLEPNSVVPLHSHPNEQLGIVLRGLQVLIVDGVEHPLGPMEGYVVPAGVEHGARFGPEGATVLDVFHPVREDYRQRWQEEASSARMGNVDLDTGSRMRFPPSDETAMHKEHRDAE